MQVLSPAPFLSIHERAVLAEKRNLRALLGICYHWLWVILAMCLVYFFPHVVSIIIALFIIGGKQLACAILMHDAGHGAVFSDKRYNDIVGRWLGAYPIFQHLDRYRSYHLLHHLKTGLEEDPDLLLTRGYPTTRSSMLRKFGRDLSGITGIKALSGLILMHLGYLEYNIGGKIISVPQEGRPHTDVIKSFMVNVGPALVFQAFMIGVLSLLASPWLYLLWIGAYLTTFQFSLRIRAMAEHSMVDDTSDPYRNTRTTHANWMEQLFFAPYHVNYHVEHHMMMSVPSYNLPKMHQLLIQRGFYNRGLLALSYWSVVKHAAKILPD